MPCEEAETVVRVPRHRANYSNPQLPSGIQIFGNVRLTHRKKRYVGVFRKPDANLALNCRKFSQHVTQLVGDVIWQTVDSMSSSGASLIIR